jgi:2-(1,2-epoxy-1,2-dihydrophenyl)acetyl-CoA isomerase
MKQVLVRAETQTLSEVAESEAFAMARCGRTQDAKEAALAFREKRTPKFTGS